MLTSTTLKDQVIEIFKQAEGKRFTYFQITSSLGVHSQPVIEKLFIHNVLDTSIHLADSLFNVDQVVFLPLIRITDIVEIEPENFDIIDAEAEYEINYDDGTRVFVQIYNGK
jgi:hypothetical protein